MQDENLKFTIELSGTYWGKRPQYSVWLDENVIEQSEISKDKKIIEFSENY